MINKLRKEMMLAKKERNTIKTNLLSTLVAEAVMIGKNDGNRETTEQEVMAIIRKFVKNLDETISLRKEAGKDIDKEQQERAVLISYLPKQFSDEELKEKISELIAELPEKSTKMMGKIMGSLKAKYEGLYDGKTASTLVRQLLQ